MPPLHQPRALQKILQNRNRYLRLLSETLPEYSLQKCKLLSTTSSSSRTQFSQKTGIDNNIDSVMSDNNSPKSKVVLQKNSLYENEEVEQAEIENASRSNNMTGALTNTRRNVLQSYCNMLNIDKEWISSVNTIMSETCRGIIPDVQIADNDLFACALIHPSFISTAKIREKEKRLRLRETLAMPAELITSGSSSVQLLNELAKTHNATVERRLQRAAEDEFSNSANNIEDKYSHENNNCSKRANTEAGIAHKNEKVKNTFDQNCEEEQQQQQLHYKRHTANQNHINKMRRTEHYAKATVIKTQDLIELPSLIQVDKYILLDANAFGLQSISRAHGAHDIPQEVVLSAAVAICGAVNLFGGIHSVAAFFDRIFGSSENKCY